MILVVGILVQYNSCYEKKSNYRYDNKNFIDLTDNQIADRIKQTSPLLNDNKLWLLNGSMVSDTKHVDDATAKVVLYNGIKFDDITSKFIYYLESKGVNLIASVNDISFGIKHMPVGKAVWNNSHWLLFGSRIYKFVPGEI